MTDLSAEKYILLTTFTKDGRPKPTPVWFADSGEGTLYAITEEGAWKLKRIANTPRVEFAPCTMSGKPKTAGPATPGTARLVPPEDASFAPLEAALLSRYGLQFRFFRWIAHLRRKSQVGIVITPERAEI